MSEHPEVLAAIASGEICTVCGSIIDKQAPGKPRTCAESDTAPRWQDPEFACPSIKRQDPSIAPELRRRRLAILFGRIETIARDTREALEAEDTKPGLENLVYQLENLIGWAKAKAAPVVKESLTTEPAAKPSRPPEIQEGGKG